MENGLWVFYNVIIGFVRLKPGSKERKGEGEGRAKSKKGKEERFLIEKGKRVED